MREKLGLPLWNENINRASNGKTTVATYDYTDEAGELLFQVVRYIPKGFRQRRPDGNGGWIWSLGEISRVLYRLPEVVEAVSQERTIYIAEGEKAVDALVGLGVPATCSAGGAGKWRDEYSQHLADANVVILPDNDQPGKRHCEAVAKSLAGVAASVRVLDLPGLPPKGDAHDWVQAGGTAEALWQLVETIGVDWNPLAHAEETRLVVKCAADIKPEKIDWLWEQRLPLGKCVLVAGEGGLGKSMVLAWLAATVSRGNEWPCDEGCARRGSVIILSAEDDAADTIVPRLIAANADCSKVHILEAVCREDEPTQRSFNLQLDLPVLERKIEELGDVLVVIIDPITSYLGKVDSHKNAELRSVLEPLGKMAARQHVTVIANTHLSKATGGNANSRVIGSVAFVNHARAAFIVTTDPEDRDKRLFLPSKTNLGKQRNGLAYRIADMALPDHRGSVIWVPYVKWEDAPVAISADEAMAANARRVDDKNAVEEAKQFLIDLLADGAKPQKEVKEAAEGAGLAWASMRRAKGLIGIKPHKAGMDAGWWWELPQGLHSTEGAHIQNVSTFGTDEHLREATRFA